MSDIDTLLSLVENPTRRQILETLVRRPNYPLQLSKELNVSQQAIMKHLRLMEEYGLVSSYEERSDRGGPARRQYVPNASFTLVIDVRHGLFSARVIQATDPEAEIDWDAVPRLDELRGEMADIEIELNDLDARRDALMVEKERRMVDAMRLLDFQEIDHTMRTFMYRMLDQPLMDLGDIARELSLRDDIVDELVKGLLRRESQ